MLAVSMVLCAQNKLGGPRSLDIMFKEGERGEGSLRPLLPPPRFRLMQKVARRGEIVFSFRST